MMSLSVSLTVSLSLSLPLSRSRFLSLCLPVSLCLSPRLRKELKQCLDRCVERYHACRLHAERNDAFLELQASLADDVPGRVGFTGKRVQRGEHRAE